MMATVTAITPFDMNAYAIVYGDTAFPFPSSFQVQNPSQIQGYFGHDFTFNNQGLNTGGVLNQTDYYLATPGFGFVLQYSITGLDHDMATVNQFQGLNNPQGLLGFLFIDNDTFSGSSGNDFAKGYAGDDSLAGGDGNDTLDGGPGADVLSGGTGSDTYIVDNPGDLVSEALAEPFPDGDTIIASLTYVLPPTMEHLVLQGAAALNGTGNAFPNAMTGNDANNVLDGAAGNDTIGGAGGNDTLIGGSGTDALSGGAGNDVYVLDGAADIVTEAVGAGRDQIQTGIALGAALAANVEILRLLGSADIDGTGNELSNVVYANTGDNVLSGGAGLDTVSYQFGAAAGVSASLGVSAPQATGGSGSDTLTSIEHLTGGSYSDQLKGNNRGNQLAGRDGRDTLLGGAGDDTLNGGAGDDSLAGGAGDDEFQGGKGIDRVDYATAASGVSVRLATKGSQDTGGAGFDSFASIENVFGSAYRDVLHGNGAANQFRGGTGNDTLAGRSGNDALGGGAGQDKFVFNSALHPSSNVDAIADFNAAADSILLDEEIFSALAVGQLAADAFYAAGGASSGNDAQDRIVYDTTSGNLYYDADGRAGAPGILFATLTGSPTVAAADFLVIA